MDEVTQQNAALVEEAAAAAESLEEQARGLVQTVSHVQAGRGRFLPFDAAGAGAARCDAASVAAGRAFRPRRPARRRPQGPPPHLADSTEQWEEF
jgi:methyl-accepting chemotaxis protein